MLQGIFSLNDGSRGHCSSIPCHFQFRNECLAHMVPLNRSFFFSISFFGSLPLIGRCGMIKLTVCPKSFGPMHSSDNCSQGPSDKAVTDNLTCGRHGKGNESKNEDAENPLRLRLRNGRGCHQGDFPAPHWENKNPAYGTNHQNTQEVFRCLGGYFEALSFLSLKWRSTFP